MFRIFIAATASLLLAHAADATLITRTLTYAGAGFHDYKTNAPGPIDPVTLTFTITFDNSHDIQPTTAGLTVLDFNLGYDLEYGYNAQLDYLSLGTDMYGTSLFTIVENVTKHNFGVSIDNLSTTPVIPNGFTSGYTIGDGHSYFQSSRTNLSVAPVPEPASWAMFVGGFGLLGAALRRRVTAGLRIA